MLSCVEVLPVNSSIIVEVLAAENSLQLKCDQPRTCLTFVVRPRNKFYVGLWPVTSSHKRKYMVTRCVNV